jgi:beta-glucosidase
MGKGVETVSCCAKSPLLDLHFRSYSVKMVTQRSRRRQNVFTTFLFATTAMATAISRPVSRDPQRSSSSPRSTHTENLPYRNVSLPVDQRVDDLVQRMTMEEKAGQLFQQIINMGANGTLANGTTQSVKGQFMTHFNLHGSIDSPRRYAEWHNRLQKLALETRLGIPVTLSSDPRHAFTDNVGTGFMAESFSQWPESLGLAAIRDAELVETFANIARQEYMAIGLRSSLHPQIDLSTEPRWARISGTMGESANLIKGFTGGEKFGTQSVTTVTKHFPGSGPVQDGEDSHFTYGKNATYPGVSSPRSNLRMILTVRRTTWTTTLSPLKPQSPLEHVK